MADLERGTKRLGQVVRQAWMAAAVPLVAMLTLTLPHQTEQVWMYQAGVLWLPPRIEQLQVGFDRTGDHVAVLDETDTIHLLQLNNGRLTAAAYPTPWTDDHPHRLRLSFADITGDQLVDLGVIRFPPRVPGRFEGLSAQAWPTAVYAQTGDTFEYRGIESRLPTMMGQSSDSVMVTAAGTFQLQAAQNVDSRAPRTHLISVTTGRVFEVLDGEPFFVADIDDDGNHDLLTIELDESLSPLSRYRLYCYRDGEFRQVWDASFLQHDGWQRMRRHTIVADLDHDRSAELILSEPELGKLTVWRLDSERIGGH